MNNQARFMSAVKPHRIPCITLLVSAGLIAAEPPLKPLRVCEVLENLPAYDGKVIAIVGRFSFRDAGRFVSEEACEKKVISADFVWPSAVRLLFNSKSAPKTPQPLEFDGQVVKEKLKLVKRHTSLGKFRFGTPDYDRWAVIYGRIEAGKDYREGAKPLHVRANGFEPTPAELVCGGEGDVLFLTDQ